MEDGKMDRCVVELGVFEGLSGSVEDRYLLHRLAFNGEIARLEQALRTRTEAEKALLDPQGNTVRHLLTEIESERLIQILHLGVLRNDQRVLEVALESGIPSKTGNSRGWSALDEAIAAKNKELVCLLYLRGLEELKAELKAAKVHLMQTLNEMPDYSMEVGITPCILFSCDVCAVELAVGESSDWISLAQVCSTRHVQDLQNGIKDSNGWNADGHRQAFKFLLARMETWEIQFTLRWQYKSCASLSCLPRHPYAQCVHQIACILKSGEYLDLTEEKNERKKNGQFDFDVDLIMNEGAGKTKLRATEFRSDLVAASCGCTRAQVQASQGMADIAAD